MQGDHLACLQVILEVTALMLMTYIALFMLSRGLNLNVENNCICLVFVIIAT